jgi:hypothetical protein
LTPAQHHDAKTTLAFITVFFCLSPAIAQQDDAGQPDAAIACATRAATEFKKQNLALLRSPDGQPTMTVGAAIARRRLREGYCLREATCLFGDAARMDNRNIPFRAEFLKCLDEQTKEE